MKIKTERLEYKHINPIYYNSLEEMESKPVSKLINDLRTDISNVRGKIQDINRAYGFDDKLDFIDGGLTSMLIAMHFSVKEFEEFEKKWGKEKLKDGY